MTVIATIDLGSNSFHMLICRVDQYGNDHALYRDKEKVQLRSGLLSDGRLTDQVQQKALACLQRFADAMKVYQVTQCKVVGTYTLRKATQISHFLSQAKHILGVPIEIVSGQEEARLVYLGALMHQDFKQQRVLVIDIGGGSTELVLGHRKQLKQAVSLEIGCVSMQNAFFGDGHMTNGQFDQAIADAKNKVQSIKSVYQSHGWDIVLGASGTIVSIADVARAKQWSDGQITLGVLNQLKQCLIEQNQVDNIELQGLRADRANILAGGLSVLLAIFETLGISTLQQSKGALREGVLFEAIEQM